MPLDRQWIEQHIPHKGRMCLLDEVLSWDAARIRCRSATHRSPDNPLRLHGRLGAACGIEYAAQAMAVHGALVAARAPLASTVSSSGRGSIGATRWSLRYVCICPPTDPRLYEFLDHFIYPPMSLSRDVPT